MSIVRHVITRLNIVPVHRIVHVDVYHIHFLILWASVVYLLKVALNLLHVNHRMMLVNSSDISVFVILDVIQIHFAIHHQCLIKVFVHQWQVKQSNTIDRDIF